MILITQGTIQTQSYQIQLQFRNPPISALRVTSLLRLSSYAANRNLSRNPNPSHSCHSCSASISTSIPRSQNQSQNQSRSDHGGGTHHRPRHPLTGPINTKRVGVRRSTGAAALTVTTTTTTTTIGLVQRVDRVRTRNPPVESGSHPLTLTPYGGTHTRRITAPTTVLVTQPTRLLLETITTRPNRAAAARAGIARRTGEECEMGRSGVTHGVISDWLRTDWTRSGWVGWKL